LATAGRFAIFCIEFIQPGARSAAQGGRRRGVEIQFLRSHWRMIFRVSGRFQEMMAEKLKRSLQNRGVSLAHRFRFPRLTINHGIVLYDFTGSGQQIKFTVYDPNVPAHPVRRVDEKARRVFTFAPDIFWGGDAQSWAKTSPRLIAVRAMILMTIPFALDGPAGVATCS
jgi:hypothetical protein